LLGLTFGRLSSLAGASRDALGEQGDRVSGNEDASEAIDSATADDTPDRW
jgi:hypothetical protein